MENNKKYFPNFYSEQNHVVFIILYQKTKREYKARCCSVFHSLHHVGHSILLLWSPINSYSILNRRT